MDVVAGCILGALPPHHAPAAQGVTHHAGAYTRISAERKRLLWDRGCIQGLFRGCLGCVKGHYVVFRVYFVSETAQVELKSGRV